MRARMPALRGETSMKFFISIILSILFALNGFSEEGEIYLRQAVDRIIEAQLPNGAIRYNLSEDKIIPYFSHFIVLGLIEAGSVLDEPTCFASARKWLQWCDRNRNEHGCVMDFIIKNGKTISTGDADSTDSYAALEIMTVQALHDAGKAKDILTKERIQSCLEAIRLTFNPETGLTFAKPDWPFQYLMDNVEVWRGLLSAESLFTELNAPNLLQEATKLRRPVENGLKLFWDNEKKYFAWAIHKNGTKSFGLKRAYPDALAQILLFDYALDPQQFGEFETNLDTALTILQKDLDVHRNNNPKSLVPLYWGYWKGQADFLLGRTQQYSNHKQTFVTALPDTTPKAAGYYLLLTLDEEKVIKRFKQRLPISFFNE